MSRVPKAAESEEGALKNFILDMGGAMLASRVAMAQLYAARFLQEPDPMGASTAVRDEMKRQLLEQESADGGEDAEINRAVFERAVEHLDRIFDQIDILLAAAELKKNRNRLV